MPLGKFATVVQAEMYALLIDTYSGKTHYRYTKSCMSDNQAALRAVSSIWSTSKLTQECQSNITELAKSNNNTIMWVPGHFLGNKNDDSLATHGAYVWSTRKKS